MADRPRRMRAHEDRVAVAIRAQLDRVQGVAARLAFAPERVAGPAVEVDLAGALGRLDRVAVHPREHEHCAGTRVLDHRGHQAALVEAHLGDVHASARSRGRTGIPAAPSTSFTPPIVSSP